MQEEKKFTKSDEAADKFDKRQTKRTGRGRRGGKDAGKGSFKPGNDLAYWNKYPQLTKEVSNYVWNYIQGTTFEFRPEGNPAAEEEFYNVPANVMVIEYLPTIGASKSPTDSFNMQMKSLWLDLHRKYRGLGSYQSSDLGLIIFAVSNAFALAAECERYYGILGSYSAYNRVRPEGLLKAMGCSDTFISSLKANLADYRYKLNRILAKMHTLCLPKGISTLLNQIALNAFVYCDSKDVRASYIVFKPTATWIYQAETFETGTALKAKILGAPTSTYDEVLDQLDECVEYLIQDDDVARVCSDLLAAYGSNNLETVSPMAEEYVVTPIYDESILLKVHNLETIYNDSHTRTFVSFGLPASLASTLTVTARELLAGVSTGHVGVYGYITQEINDHGSYIISDAVVTLAPNNNVGANVAADRGGLTVINAVETGGNGAIEYFMVPATQGSAFTVGMDNEPQYNHICDTWEEDPSDATRFECLLWKRNTKSQPFGLLTKNGTTAYNNVAVSHVESCATELILDVNVYGVLKGAVAFSTPIPTFIELNGGLISAEKIFGVTKFDWAPLLFGMALAEDNKAWATSVVGDLDNATFMKGSLNIERCHDTAVLSGFCFDIGSVPQKD